jgi:NADH:ubiquinone reductase (H+-translocating)
MEQTVVNIPETNTKRIVIIGGGFAGLTLAKKLINKNYQIVIFDKNNYHQFQPLFYQVAMAGLEPSSISFPLRKVFQKETEIHIRVAEVKEINTAENKIVTDIGICNYDILILAIGAKTNFYGNANIEQNAFSLKSTGESLYLRNQLLKDLETAIITRDYDKRQEYIDTVIVGGGPTGVEVAGALAELKNYVLPKDYIELNNGEVDIYLIHSGDHLLPGMSSKSSIAAEKFLLDLGVVVKKNTRVTDVLENKVTLSTGEIITSRKVIWAAGIIGNTVQGLAHAQIDRSNRIAVDATNKVIGYDNIYAIGDIAQMASEAYPQGHPQVAQVAMQQATNLAKNLVQNTSKPFIYNDKGSMATIGRNKAVVDLKVASFQGFFAWILWLAVHLFSLIGTRNKLFVMFNWITSYFTYDQSLRLIMKASKRG